MKLSRSHLGVFWALLKPSGRSWGHLEADSSHLGTTFDKTRAILQRSWGGGGYERIVNERSDVTDVRKLLIKSVVQKLGDKIYVYMYMCICIALRIESDNGVSDRPVTLTILTLLSGLSGPGADDV